MTPYSDSTPAATPKGAPGETNGNGATPHDAPTPAAEYRMVREQGVLLQIQSGRRVLMRNVTPDALLKLGKIPDILTPLVLKMVYEGVETEEITAFWAPRERVDETLEMLESLRVVCTAALIYPRIVDNPQAEDEIAIEDLSLAERGSIFHLALQPAELLQRFRVQPQTDVEPVPDGARLPEPSE